MAAILWGFAFATRHGAALADGRGLPAMPLARDLVWLAERAPLPRRTMAVAARALAEVHVYRAMSFETRKARRVSPALAEVTVDRIVAAMGARARSGISGLPLFDAAPPPEPANDR